MTTDNNRADLGISEREPLTLRGAVVSIILAAAWIAGHFGVDVPEGTTSVAIQLVDALLIAGSVLAPLVTAVWARHKVTPVAALRNRNGAPLGDGEQNR